jgi:tetratricopeptide (TPR) repeat protein
MLPIRPGLWHSPAAVRYLQGLAVRLAAIAARAVILRCLVVLFGAALLVLASLVTAAAQQGDFNAALRRFGELYAARKYSAALVEAQKFESMAKARFGVNHANYGAALNNLGLVYKEQGKYADAEELYRRALAIYERTIGAAHPNAANALHNLANVYVAQGKYADAEGLYKRVLAIDEKTLGPSHLYVAATLHTLAGVYDEQGKYAEAEGLYKRALAIREKALGPSHLDVAQTLDNLALLYREQSRYTDAEGLHKRALAIREKALGKEHGELAMTLSRAKSTTVSSWRARWRSSSSAPTGWCCPRATPSLATNRARKHYRVSLARSSMLVLARSSSRIGLSIRMRRCA